jgi:hypothetical protein
MAEHPRWFVSDRNPAIADTVTIGGVPVDLTTLTVTFKMRAVGSSTLKVNAAVSTKEADGDWTYNWGANDLDTAGEFLVWVTVDMGGGALETVNEALIHVFQHAPQTNAYVELEEFKSTAELTGKTFADGDILVALVAASRGIDDALGRRFYADVDAAQVRYYTPLVADRLWTDDIVTLTELATDPGGDGTYEDVWTLNTDFTLGPLNAAADGKPYTHIDVHPGSSLYLPCSVPRSVKVTGKFGWAAPPAAVKTLTRLVAARLLKRTREAPLGFVELGVDGAAVRASSYARDPDYNFLIGGLDRSVTVG